MKLMVIFFFSIIQITMMFYLINIANLNTAAFAVDYADSLLTYNNSKHNFSIQYPSTWELIENRVDSEVENISSTIEIKSPFEGAQDLLQEEFLISINKLQENITFNDYVDNALNEFKNVYKDFQLISNNLTKIDNHNGRKLSYSYIAGEDPLSIKLIMNHNIILDGNKVYVLSFGTPPNKYYEYSSLIQKIINSFNIFE
jgi:hypothetical protein